MRVPLLLTVVIILVFSVGGGAIAQPYSERTGTGEWKTKPLSEERGCGEMAGSYEFWGEGAAGMPVKFRGLVPYSLDVVTGTDIPMDERHKTSGVQLRYEGSKLELSFQMPGAFVTRTITGSRNVHFACYGDRLMVTKSDLDTRGEAVSGKTDVVYDFYLGEDDSLIIHSHYDRETSFLFFFKKRYGEDYLVKFKKMSPRNES